MLVGEGFSLHQQGIKQVLKLKQKIVENLIRLYSKQPNTRVVMAQQGDSSDYLIDSINFYFKEIISPWRR